MQSHDARKEATKPLQNKRILYVKKMTGSLPGTKSGARAVGTAFTLLHRICHSAILSRQIFLVQTRHGGIVRHDVNHACHRPVGCRHGYRIGVAQTLVDAARHRFGRAERRSACHEQSARRLYDHRWPIRLLIPAVICLSLSVTLVIGWRDRTTR